MSCLFRRRVAEDGCSLPDGPLGVFDRQALEKYLDIPAEQELMALIAIGYPVEACAAPGRKDVSTLLSYR